MILEVLRKLVDHVVDLLLDHGRGKLDLHVLRRLFKQRGVELGVGVFVGGLLKALTDGLFILVQRVELGHVLGKLIVQRGELLLLDLAALDVEHGGLTGEILGLIVLREGDVDVLFLTGGHTDDLLLKAGDKHLRAKDKVMPLALAAVKGNAVHAALKVDDGGIALLGGTLDRHDTTGAFTRTFDLGVDLLILDIDDGTLGGQRLIFAQLGLRPLRRGEAERELLSVGNIHASHGGRADVADLFLLNAELERLRRERIGSVLIENILAVHTLDDHAGRFALAEALDIDLAAVFEVGRLQRLLKFLRSDDNIEAHGGFFFSFYVSDLHSDLLLLNITLNFIIT